jgi:hypothetical protein
MLGDYRRYLNGVSGEMRYTGVESACDVSSAADFGEWLPIPKLSPRPTTAALTIESWHLKKKARGTPSEDSPV